MTLTPEQKQQIKTHTEGMWLMERVRSAKHIIKKYLITDNADIREVAELADVPVEKLGDLLKPVTMQQRLT